ncbi:DnaJ subfamily B member 6 [Gossypium arboreum]|uniref:DnaJ subfamily B member 6 n=1 Tax=Gossypium arboreum TaxID=29729 RepID=A0A0B0Q0D1_GOSAR|nr:DnaJ subfamily B member 6 [Gossypium arboreum]
MHIPRWRNVFLLKSSLVPPFLYSKATATVATTHVASFHSSPITCEKWKSKWDFYFISYVNKYAYLFPPLATTSCIELSFRCLRKEEHNNQLRYIALAASIYNHIRYRVHQRRADTKSALKNLLYNSGCSNVSFQDEVRTWKFDGTEGWDSDGSDKKRLSRYSGRHAGKSNRKKVKRNFRRESFSDDFDHPERIFQAKFGNKWYTWTSGGDKSFKNPESGFEWREKSGWINQRTKEWENTSDSESESEEEKSYDVGSCSDREILGLPRAGPIKIEDVKNAFRISALKWHPDKHQGPSQEMAEEKFKMCVGAYKSLCHALS